MKNSFSKILIYLALVMLLISSVAVVSTSSETKEVIEISPTQITRTTVPLYDGYCGDGICTEDEKREICVQVECICEERKSAYSEEGKTCDCPPAKCYMVCETDCAKEKPACAKLCPDGSSASCKMINGRCVCEPCPTQPACESTQCPDGTWTTCRLDEDGKCVCSTCPAIQERPICTNIGTRSEGWYLNGELIKYDKCVCVAVCKAIGTRSEGWYSSCTGELIKYETCFTEIGIALKEKSVRIEQKAEEGVVEIRSEATATTKEKIVVEEGRLGISTAEGVKDVNYLPEEAKSTAVTAVNMYEVTSIELIKENEKPVYKVTGKTRKYFLWIIPITRERSVKVDAGTNQIIG